MKWESIDHVISYFNLKIKNKDRTSVKKAIRKLIFDLHPDRNMESMTDEKKEKLQTLNSAKDYLDTIDAPLPNSAMVPVAEIYTLFERLREPPIKPIEEKIATLKQEAHIEFKSQSHLPRIGSGVFAAISGFLFTFSGNMKDNPLLGPLSQNLGFQALLISVMLCSALFFVMTWMQERRKETIVERLTSEEGIRETVRYLLKSNRTFESESPLKFTLRDITTAVYDRNGILGNIAEKVAKTQIDFLMERGVLLELPHRGFDKVYILKEEATTELLNEKRISNFF